LRSIAMRAMSIPTKPRAGPDVYVRFLQMAETVRGLPAPVLLPLDPLEERILVIVACARGKHARLSVRDLMGKHELGAPATIHGRLKTMREKGWITLADTEDARRKQVEPTPAAMQHFTKLSRCVVRAAST